VSGAHAVPLRHACSPLWAVVHLGLVARLRRAGLAGRPWHRVTRTGGAGVLSPGAALTDMRRWPAGAVQRAGAVVGAAAAAAVRDGARGCHHPRARRRAVLARDRLVPGHRPGLAARPRRLETLIYTTLTLHRMQPVSSRTPFRTGGAARALASARQLPEGFASCTALHPWAGWGRAGAGDQLA